MSEPDDAASRALARARAYAAQEHARREALARSYMCEARAALGTARTARTGRLAGLSAVLGLLLWPFMHNRGKD